MRTDRRGLALISSAHVVNDFYQGAVPAILPFLAIAGGYSLAAVAGLTLAATAISSVAQPVFGWWADRKGRAWIIWAGMILAAAGIAVTGLSNEYAVIWVALAASGLGIAAFHPEAARVARRAAGNSSTAMSVFALGGNVGYALGPAVTAAVVVWLGGPGIVALLLPALVMAFLLISARRRPLHHSQHSAPGALRGVAPENDRGSFVLLTVGVVIRSVVFFGITSFLALHLISRFDLPTQVAAGAVSVFLGCGIVGTLLGGFVADRLGKLVSFRTGFVLAGPALLGVVLAPTTTVAIVFTGLTGIALYMPFAVMVVLGQDYLPRNIGTASGITVGLAVSVGGLLSPVLGWIADQTSLTVTFVILAGLPLLAVLVTLRLRDAKTSRSSPWVGQ